MYLIYDTIASNSLLLAYKCFWVMKALGIAYKTWKENRSGFFLENNRSVFEKYVRACIVREFSIYGGHYVIWLLIEKQRLVVEASP